VFELLDECCTSMGSRQLMQWLRAPSTDEQVINRRLAVVQDLCERPAVRDRLRAEALKGCPDAERLVRAIQTAVRQQHADGLGQGNAKRGNSGKGSSTQKNLSALISLYHFVSITRHVTQVLSDSTSDVTGVLSDSTASVRRKRRHVPHKVTKRKNTKRSRHFGNPDDNDDDDDDDDDDGMGGNSDVSSDGGGASGGANGSQHDTSPVANEAEDKDNSNVMKQLLSPLRDELKTLEAFELLIEKTIDPDSIVQRNGPSVVNLGGGGGGGAFFCRANPAFVPALQRIDKRMAEVVREIRQLAVETSREVCCSCYWMINAAAAVYVKAIIGWLI
jgi:hypothetical protein